MPTSIFVKSLTGKTIPIECELTDTVLSIKEKFHEIEGVPVEEIRLIFGGKQLNDADTLESYAIQTDSIIFVVLRLRGGASFGSNPYFNLDYSLNALLFVNLINSIQNNYESKEPNLKKIMFDDVDHKKLKHNYKKQRNLKTKFNTGRKYLKD